MSIIRFQCLAPEGYTDCYVNTFKQLHWNIVLNSVISRVIEKVWFWTSKDLGCTILLITYSGLLRNHSKNKDFIQLKKLFVPSPLAVCFRDLVKCLGGLATLLHPWLSYFIIFQFSGCSSATSLDIWPIYSVLC